MEDVASEAVLGQVRKGLETTVKTEAKRDYHHFSGKLLPLEVLIITKSWKEKEQRLLRTPGVGS